MENGGEGKSNVRKREGESCSEIGLSEEREGCFLGFNKRVFSFSIILFKQCHMSPFEWSKKGPLSLFDCDPHSVTKVRKI